MRHHFIDEYSTVPGFLQGLDPRVKLCTFVFLVLGINGAKNNGSIALLFYAMIILILIALAKTPLVAIVKKVSLILPFTLLVSLSLFFASPKSSFFFLAIIAKSILSVTALVLLVSTTSFHALLKAMERIKIPVLFLTIASFMYRYLFIITDEVMSAKLAKDSRSGRGNFWLNTKVNANILGVLFLNAYEKSERVYQAMQARGFNGTIHNSTSFALKPKDFAFIFFFLLIIFGIVVIERCV